MCCTFYKQACMRDILNTQLVRDREFKACQPIPTCLFKKCDIGTPECTSLHIIGIVVTVTLVTVHDFTFQLSMRSFTHFEDFATMKMAASATVVRTGDSKRNSNQLICRCFNHIKGMI